MYPHPRQADSWLIAPLANPQLLMLATFFYAFAISYSNNVGFEYISLTRDTTCQDVPVELTDDFLLDTVRART
jgi:hypothetical protein